MHNWLAAISGRQLRFRPRDQLGGVPSRTALRVHLGGKDDVQRASQEVSATFPSAFQRAADRSRKGDFVLKNTSCTKSKNLLIGTYTKSCRNAPTKQRLNRFVERVFQKPAAGFSFKNR